MLSARSSLISTNWPDLTLSTSFCGNGSDAGERIRPELCGGCEPLASCVAGVGGNRALGAEERGGAWVPARSATEVSRLGGGRAPSCAAK